MQVGGPGLEKGEVGVKSECAFCLFVHLRCGELKRLGKQEDGTWEGC